MSQENDTTSDNLINHFLIAMPQLQDSYFGNTVIYMWQHNQEGSLGSVINLPIKMQFSEVMEQLEIEVTRLDLANLEVLSGGPVEVDKGFIIHDSPGDWSSSFMVTDDIQITTSKDILSDISHGEGPENFLFTLGCAGWSPGQLEQELKDNAWITCPASKEILFSKDYEKKPDMAAATLGFTMSQLSSDASFH